MLDKVTQTSGYISCLRPRAYKTGCSQRADYGRLLVSPQFVPPVKSELMGLRRRAPREVVSEGSEQRCFFQKL
jgi:hypothetical protein